MKKKRIAYDYTFNYFGGDTKDGHVVNGASITLNIRAYKNGQEVLFADGDEVTTHGKYLNNVFDISFDREHQFVIKKNLQMDNLFRLAFGWDRIEASVIGYDFDIVIGTVGELDGPDCGLPKEFLSVPVADPVKVSEKEFRSFLAAHADEFDIPDNKYAQVPSVLFYNIDD